MEYKLIGQKKKKRKILGIPIALFIIGILFVGGVSAALLQHFGMITTTINVSRAVGIQGTGCSDNVCTESMTAAGGETKTTNEYTATSQTSVDVPIKITTTEYPIDGGIETNKVEYKLHAEGETPREKRIRVEASDLGISTLNDLNRITFEQDVIVGYIGHVDVILEDKTLVFEYAKVDPSDCDDSGDYPSGEVNTFGDKGIVNSGAYAWLSSGPPGPCGDGTFDANHKSLADWKVSDGSKSVVALEFEVDSWIETSTGTMKDLKVNGNPIDTVTVQINDSVVFNLEIHFANGAEGIYTLGTEIQVE